MILLNDFQLFLVNNILFFSAVMNLSDLSVRESIVVQVSLMKMVIDLRLTPIARRHFVITVDRYYTGYFDRVIDVNYAL